MDVSKSLNNLFEEEPGDILLETPSLLNIREQVSTRAEFHHETDVLLSLEGIEQPDNIRVVGLLQDSHLQLGSSAQILFAL